MAYNYTIYRHITPSGKSYVGITRMKYLSQRFKKNGIGYKSCPLFYKAIQKYGWDNIKHEILEQNVTEDKIDEREKYWISYYQSNNRTFGYNIEEGGYCVRTFSPETRKKISDAKKGKSLSLEHRRKLSQANLGHHNSPEAEAKRIAKRVRPVLQFDLNNNFIQEYPSIKQAAENLQIDSSGISKVCKNKLHQCGGYIWKYKEVF